MSYDPIETGKRIRIHRESLGISRVVFSEELNISPSHLQKIETGAKGASIDLLVDISERYEISLDYLLKGCISPVPGDAETKTVLESVIIQLSSVVERIGSSQEAYASSSQAV